MIFKDINELVEYLEKDKLSKNVYSIRFPARFILLNNYKSLHELINKIEDRVNVISIADSLLKENVDGWLTLSHVNKFVRDLDPRSDYIILGISELLRLYSEEEFFVILNSIVEIEGGLEKNRRIYIPLIGMKNRVENAFLNKYPRISEWDPLWIVSDDKEEKIKIYLISFELKDALIKSVKDYLNLWKNEKISKSIVSCSNTLYYFSDKIVPDEVFNFEKVENIKDYIKKVLDINVPIEYDKDENELWGELLSKIIISKLKFKDFAENILNIRNLNLDNVLDLWYRGDVFSRWILKWYILNINEFKNTYIFHVIKDVKNYSSNDLLGDYWLKILSLDSSVLSKNMFEERRKLLRNFYNKSKEEVPKYVEEKLAKGIESLPKNEVQKYLVGISKFEKTWIIENLDYINNIHEVYPELSYYLEDLYFDNCETTRDWVIEYFREYRYSKLKNSISKRLLEILNEKNKNRDSFYNWYYSFERIRDIYYELAEEKLESKKVFVDGLGIEFLNLFIKLLEKEGFVVHVYIGTSEVPSITEYNKLTADEVINDLDKYIHDQTAYKYQLSIVEEIELIKNIVKKISDLGDDLIIYSDHGFTVCPAFQDSGVKRYNFKETEHEGRCMEIDSKTHFVEDEDFFVHTFKDQDGRERKYLVALKYISLSHNIPRREVHGGATPEEVLVPLIYASRSREKEKYEISVLKSDIYVRKPLLEIRIEPRPKMNVIVEYSKVSRQMEYDENEGIYKVMLEEVKVGKMELKVKIGSFEKNLVINIIGGIKENELL